MVPLKSDNRYLIYRIAQCVCLPFGELDNPDGVLRVVELVQVETNRVIIVTRRLIRRHRFFVPGNKNKGLNHPYM
jgi:hypothetical protein